MRHSGIAETSQRPRQTADPQAEKRTLTESVAHALWEERRRRELPDDPEADWYRAEELIQELWNHRPPERN